MSLKGDLKKINKLTPLNVKKIVTKKARAKKNIAKNHCVMCGLKRLESSFVCPRCKVCFNCGFVSMQKKNCSLCKNGTI